MVRRRLRSIVLGGLAPVAILFATVVSTAPALACSCALTTPDQVADEATFAFVGTEVGRVETGGRDRTDSVLVTFAVDEWLSHTDGPAEFQAFTGHGRGDCGIGPLRGQVAVFAYGPVDSPNVNICGSLQPIAESVAAFEGRTPSAYPIPFDDPPPPSAPGGSYTDILLPAVVGAPLIGALAYGIARIRRSRAEGGGQDSHDAAS
jgi:hypothetical protein